MRSIEFREELISRYWTYQKRFFPDSEQHFDRPENRTRQLRPPVFKRHKAFENVIVNPAASAAERSQLISLVLAGERHKWYGSMNSSQALAQSILGNLAVHDSLGLLGDLLDDDGISLFGSAHLSPANFRMELKIDFLGEPRPTSIDAHIAGEYEVVIEAKFTEPEVGTCSRPRLKPSASNYASDYCDGTYSLQGGRVERCPLTERGVFYWNHTPQFFRWKNDQDYDPCPLNANYQLVRNILAVGVRRDHPPSKEDGHAVLLYDERNPAFQNGGQGFKSYAATKEALQTPSMLRKCSWQRIVQHLRDANKLPWLTFHLEQKYGL